MILDLFERERAAGRPLVAAFVVGTAILMAVFHPGSDESWLGWFFAAGLIAAAVFGIWLLLAIWRSGRH